MPDSIHRFIENLSSKIEELEIRFHEAYWESQIEASPENDAARAELELELRKLKGDAEALARVQSALSEDIHEPLLKRQLEVLRSSLTGNQMGDAEREEIVALSTQVESEFASFRPEVDGVTYNENQIDDVLRGSDDSSVRKRVWQASKEVGGVVAERVRELARARNAAARDLGYADFYRMDLELQELSEDWLFGVMGDLERLTNEPFRTWKEGLDASLKKRFGTNDLYPWHYADPFFQQLPPDGRVTLDDVLADASAEQLALDTFAAWDIDLKNVMAASDLYPRERKCQHAFCLQIDRKQDVRILANVVPGERWVETMLHESGHAAYDICIDRRLPYLLRRPTHIFVTEAIALLSGRLARDPKWLTDIAGIPSSTVDQMAERLHEANVTQGMQFARWGLVMVHFERDLYSDPEGDLDARWWEYVERFQHLELPNGAAPEGAWASKIHLAVAPVYYHNYLLGDLLASQLATTAVEATGGLIGTRDAGDLLKEKVFKPGSSMRWDELIVAATDRPLAATDFAADLAV